MLKLRFFAPHVSASEAGDYYQMSFETDDPAAEATTYPPAPYLFIQRQFEDYDGGLCYVETHEEDYIGHYPVRLLALDEAGIVLEILRKPPFQIEVTFAVDPQTFDAVRAVADVIFSQQSR